MKTIKAIISMLLVVAVLAPVPTNAESPTDLVVFVNTKSNIRSLTVDELKQIFLKQKTRWAGDKINCINAPEGSAARRQFREKVLGMTATEEATYWQNQKIRSQLSPPIQISNTPKAVFSLSNSVSYAFRKDVPEGVTKIVFVVH